NFKSMASEYPIRVPDMFEIGTVHIRVYIEFAGQRMARFALVNQANNGRFAIHYYPRFINRSGMINMPYSLFLDCHSEMISYRPRR
ncbi:hypothetical protein R0J89_17380, partial [Psychrobacter sp. SIMBA_152]